MSAPSTSSPGPSAAGAVVDPPQSADVSASPEPAPGPAPAPAPAPPPRALPFDELARTAPASVLRPMEYFVAWQGVIALAYTGLPPALKTFKERLREAHPGLAPENPGSKWPKTTLGVLKDGKRLSPEQLRTLKTVCEEESLYGLLREVGEKEAPVVGEVSAVVYECRSLERVISEQCVPCGAGGGPSRDPPEPQEVQAVTQVVNEFSWDHLEEYWFHVSKDGNREAHYRSAAVGATCVHFLGRQPGNAMLREAIQQFRAHVDKALPGMYTWFDDTSLHITLTALA